MATPLPACYVTLGVEMIKEILVNDPKLFGNEAADDEDPETLNTYFVDQPGFHKFWDEQNQLFIARARKGIGKSALLNHVSYREQNNENSIVISCSGSDIQKFFKPSGGSPHELINAWQDAIGSLICYELGKIIGVPKDGIEFSLLEYSRRKGSVGGNIFSAILERVNITYPISLLEKTDINKGNLLSEYMKKRDNIKYG